MSKKKRKHQNHPPGTTMLYWLARTASEVRQPTDVSYKSIGDLAGVGYHTVWRFENEPGKAWPREPDALITAYALLCGVPDARDIWAKALGAWKKSGQIPRLEELPPEVQSLLLAAEANERSRPDGGESQAKPTSKRTRRASG